MQGIHITGSAGMAQGSHFPSDVSQPPNGVWEGPHTQPSPEVHETHQQQLTGIEQCTGGQYQPTFNSETYNLDASTWLDHKSAVSFIEPFNNQSPSTSGMFLSDIDYANCSTGLDEAAIDVFSNLMLNLDDQIQASSTPTQLFIASSIMPNSSRCAQMDDEVSGYSHDQPLGSYVSPQDLDQSSSHTRTASPLARRQPSPLRGLNLSNSNTDNRTLNHAASATLQGTVQRTEDGSWRCNEFEGGPTGIGPDARTLLDEVVIPSLIDQDEDRRRASTKHEVEQWLLNSDSQTIEAQSHDTSAELEIHSSPFNHKRRPSLPRTDYMRSNGKTALGTQPFIYQNHRSDANENAEGVHNDDDVAAVRTSPPVDPNLVVLDSNITEPSEIPGSQRCKPWVDTPIDQSPTGLPRQPSSSQAAITRFMQRARDIETASLTATIGSRRRSDTDLTSLFSAAGISIRVPTVQEEIGQVDQVRRPSIFDRVMHPRSSSSMKKRKGDKSNPDAPSSPTTETGKDTHGSLFAATHMRHWARPKSPKPEPSSNITPTPMSPNSATSLAPPKPWTSAINVIKRSRSRSDISNSTGIAEMWRGQGGPPLPTLKAPSSESHFLGGSEQSEGESFYGQNNEDDADGELSETFNMAMSTVPSFCLNETSSTYDDFRAQIAQLYPSLPAFFIERVAHEQVRRYNRLIKYKAEHTALLREKKCPSGDLCAAYNHGLQYGAPKPGSKSTNGMVLPSQLTPPNDSAEEAGEIQATTLTATGTYLEGVPQLQFQQLPADLECPICFHVKHIAKPSDWTKHVAEDVQPFTCTFRNCGEARSFMRKADWIRHENEGHRHLEEWLCEFPGCLYVCYRKNNFLQHLVREHKQPEPRVRGNVAQTEDQRLVSQLVDRCRSETMKKPTDEPCLFCGSLHTTWKKLTDHLAKHMEEIAMPILTLVDQTELGASTVTSLKERALSQTASPISDSSRSISYTAQSTVKSTPRKSMAAEDLIPSNGSYTLDNGVQQHSESQFHGSTQPQWNTVSNSYGPTGGGPFSIKTGAPSGQPKAVQNTYPPAGYGSVPQRKYNYIEASLLSTSPMDHLSFATFHNGPNLETSDASAMSHTDQLRTENPNGMQHFERDAQLNFYSEQDVPGISHGSIYQPPGAGDQQTRDAYPPPIDLSHTPPRTYPLPGNNSQSYYARQIQALRRAQYQQQMHSSGRVA